MFKKKKLKARKKQNSIFIIVVGFLSVAVIFSIALTIIDKVSDANFNIYKGIIQSQEIKDFLTLSSEDKIKLEKLKLEKKQIEDKLIDNTQKTNILII